MRFLRTPGRGLRAASRRNPRLAGAVLLAAVLAACGGPDGSTPPGETPASPDAPASGAPGATSTQAAIGSTDAFSLEHVGGIELEVARYELPEVLAGPGGPELTAMLSALDLDRDDVGVTIAIDPEGRLAIGYWQLPGAGATAILDAWAATGAGWSPATTGGRAALSGIGPDGDRAWVSAADGVFLFVSTEDPALADAAIATLGPG